MIYSWKKKIDDCLSVGNKSFYLHKISSFCNVPHFVTLGTDVFPMLLELEENRELKDLITQVFLNKLGIVYKLDDIQKKIDEIYIPESFVEQLREELYENNVTPPYAVRSSSTMEDGQRKSAAGIYESYCNVSEYELINSIKNCWKSNFTVRSLCYEEITDDVDKRINSMGVIIQHFVGNAEVSGVFFSVDPLSPENGAITEYVEGTAEELMAGMKTPITETLGFYIEDVSKQHYKFEKEWMYELLSIGSRLQKENGCPVDVEWVYADNHISIIQCRPITTSVEVSKNHWIVPVSKCVEIPKEERGGLADYVIHLQKKKVPFYKACEVCNVTPIGWFFIRYGQGIDLNTVAHQIVEKCGKGFYAIMFNKVLLDFQCKDENLSTMLKDILLMSGQENVTVSIKYIPHNEMSIISYYHLGDESVRIEAVPGIMKGIKSGYLKPTTFVLDKNYNIVFEDKVRYTSYYDIDLETDTFIEPKVDLCIYDSIKKYVKEIADSTRILHNAGIIGDIEWWICNGRLYATDYSIEERKDIENSSCSLNRISGGDIKGYIFIPDEKALADLEYLSYGCSISADEYDERVNELESISRLSNEIDRRKKEYGKVILAIPRPLLGLSPILDMVDGVVLESASRLCHLSVIIREKKIPAIEIGEDFVKLKEGQYIEYVD